MKKSKDINPGGPDPAEHKKIVLFLADELPKFMDENKLRRKKSESIKTLLKALYAGKSCSFELPQKLITKNLDIGKRDRSYVSRKVDDLNHILIDFCKEYGINPPIQLFFYHQDSVQPFGCHFACSEPEMIRRKANSGKSAYRTIQCSNKIVSFDKARRNKKETGRVIKHDKMSDTGNSKEQQGSIEPLQHISHILKIGAEYKETSTSHWFRPTGPIAIDFDDKKVCSRKSKVNELTKLVMDNPFSLLVGEAATGKTVLARDMAYTLYKEGSHDIYYFKYRDFDFDICELAEVINSLRGIIILEDMHLNILKFQQLYSFLRPNQSRHLLFVLRDGLDSFQDLTNYDDLRKLPALHINPFEDADKIIEDYCNHSKTPRIVWNRRNQVKEISNGDFWLLAFALQAAAKEDDEKPIEWLKDGIEGYLQSLENCGDEKFEDNYPRILLALSPLSMNEVFTHEKFLMKLGFRRDELKALCKRGEIVRQEKNGDIFYGLPHSSLAKAYWEHGKKYRDYLPEYEDFIYDYAKSGVCNVLEAVAKTDDVMRKVLLKRISNAGLLPSIVKSENALENVTYILLCDSDFCAEIMSDELIQVLSSRIDNTDDMINAGKWIGCLGGIDYGDQLWENVDHKKLADKLSSSVNLRHVGYFLGFLREYSNKAERVFWRLIKQEKLVERLNGTDISRDVFVFFLHMLECDEKTGMKLWNQIDQDNLAHRISHCSDYHQTVKALFDIFKHTPEINLGFLADADWQTIGSKLSKDESAWKISSSITLTGMLNKALSLKLCKSLDCSFLSMTLCKPSNINNLGDCIFAISDIAPDIGRELCKCLDLNVLAGLLNKHFNVGAISKCIDAVQTAEPDIAGNLCALLDIDSLIKKISEPNQARYACSCITCVINANPAIGHSIWNYLEKKSLAENMISEECFLEAIEWIPRLYRAEMSIAKELWSFFDLNKLVAVLIGLRSPYFFATFLFNMSLVDKTAARQLCEHFQMKELEKKFQSMNDFEFQLCLEALCLSCEEIGGVLCNKLDFEQVVKKLTAPEQVSLEHCIRALHAVNPNKSKRLAKLIQDGR